MIKKTYTDRILDLIFFTILSTIIGFIFYGILEYIISIKIFPTNIFFIKIIGFSYIWVLQILLVLGYIVLSYKTSRDPVRANFLKVQKNGWWINNNFAVGFIQITSLILLIALLNLEQGDDTIFIQSLIGLNAVHFITRVKLFCYIIKT